MNLDEELAQLLASLGVTLEVPDQATATSTHQRPEGMQRDNAGESSASRVVGDGESLTDHVAFESDEESGDLDGEAEVSLFQTSREHYGVFYRLDLVAGQPQLRVFVPDEGGATRMRCYVVRATGSSPVRAWFAATRAHDGSLAYEDARDTTEQHLLFAAGETLKRLFWAGELETLRFPEEIAVSRVL